MLIHHSSQDYEEAKSEAAKAARATMEKKIEEGRASASTMIEHVMSHVPKDVVAKGKVIEFVVNDGLNMQVQGEAMTLHRHALGQVAGKARVPMEYLSRLLEDKSRWSKNLAASILNEHYHQNEDLSQNRHLVRAVDGAVKGFLSSRYRRLDSRPMIDAFVEEAQKFDLVPIEGNVCETRYSLKAALPVVFEPIQGETMMLYAEWGNSDFGSAKHSVGLGVWRLACTNKALVQDGLSSIHLGKELDENIDFSEKTYQLDTRTQVSALKDVIRSFFRDGSVTRFLEGIKRANANQVEWKSVATKLAKVLLKTEINAAKAAFESDDCINLPPVRSVWRASNALSWIAGKAEDPDRRLQLERVAGKLVSGEAMSSEEVAA